MATINKVGTDQAKALVDSLNPPVKQGAAPGTLDGLIALGEILGKGLAALSGNEQAMGLAKDIKQGNDANRLRGFYDALAAGENPAMPAFLGAEGQQAAQAASMDSRRQNLAALLQALQQLQGVETAQGQINATSENLATQEQGANTRQAAQLATTERVATADRASQERQTAARVAAQNRATDVTRALGEAELDIKNRDLGHDIWMDLTGQNKTGRSGTPTVKIGDLLSFLQSANLSDAQRGLIDQTVSSSLLNILRSGQFGLEQQGQDGSLAAFLQALQGQK